MKKRINSRAKGARGERLFRDVLRGYGFEARRGQQFSGGKESPDIISSIEWVHWEVKCVQSLNLSKAMSQATRDCGTKVPVVAHKKDFEEWFVTMPADCFLNLVEDYEVLQKKLANS